MLKWQLPYYQFDIKMYHLNALSRGIQSHSSGFIAL